MFNSTPSHPGLETEAKIYSKNVFARFLRVFKWCQTIRIQRRVQKGAKGLFRELLWRWIEIKTSFEKISSRRLVFMMRREKSGGRKGKRDGKSFYGGKRVSIDKKADSFGHPDTLKVSQSQSFTTTGHCTLPDLHGSISNWWSVRGSV